MDSGERIEMLQCMAGCVPENASAENEEKLLLNFLPLRSYSKLADSRVFLITGDRGSGKTELFQILTSCNGLNHILSENDKKRYTDLKNVEFIVGYIATGEKAKLFPTSNVCSKWIKEKNQEEIMVFWCGLVCSVLLKWFKNNDEASKIAKEKLGKDLFIALEEKSSEISKWWKLVYTHEEQCESFLNALDEWLKSQDKCIYLVYDELDRICGNYRDVFGFIRNLLSYWFFHNNRFSNIKAKIFLRSDLYNAKALQFTDASKMRAYHLELKWNSLSLYRMFVKRIVNADSDRMLRYLLEIPGLILPGVETGLGYMPCDSEEPFHQLMEKMIGKYMGKTPKRGLSYSWIPNHIQDANGGLAPRPFLKCFSFAATEMLLHSEDMQHLEEEKLLLPTRLQGALAEVSADRVAELLEEYQWLQELIDRLKGKTMLMEKKEFMSYLNPVLWPEERRCELPGKSGEEILEALLGLGIVMETTDNRINVPEIYLHGFGLKRKGGIKRPQ